MGSHHGSAASNNTSFGLMFPELSSYAQTFIVFPVLLLGGLGQMARLRIIQKFNFKLLKKMQSDPIRFQNRLNINKSGRNQ